MEGIEILPDWLRWCSIAVAWVFTLATSCICMALVQWSGLRRFDDSADWEERARQSWPIRQIHAQVGLVVACISALFASRSVGVASPLSIPVVAAVAFALALAVWLAFSFRLLHRLFGERVRAGAFVSSLALQGCLFWLPIWVAALGVAVLPGDANLWYLLAVVLGCALVWIWLVRGGAFWILARLGIVRPAPPALVALVDAAVERVGTRPVRAEELSWMLANAFAHPIRRTISFSTRALAIMDQAELRAICLHEISHLDEPRIAVVKRCAVLGLLAVIVVIRPLVHHVSWLGGLGALVLMLWIGRRVTIFARRMEEQADRHAHEHSEDETIYVRALARVHEDSLVPVVLDGARRSHPDLWDRTLAAGVDPGHEKPLPPPKRRGTSLIAISALVVLTAIHQVGTVWNGRRGGPVRAIAAGGGTGADLIELGYQWRQSRPLDGVALIRAALEHDDRPEWRAYLAVALAYAHEEELAATELAAVEAAFASSEESARLENVLNWARDEIQQGLGR